MTADEALEALVPLLVVHDVKSATGVRIMKGITRINQTAAFEKLLAACQMEELHVIFLDAAYMSERYILAEEKLSALCRIHGMTEGMFGPFVADFRRAVIAAATTTPTEATNREE
jgi:hypothetical protein